MLFVEVRPGCKFDLILGGSPGLAIPPRAATVQVISNIRGSNRAHWQSIAQIFYTGSILARAFSSFARSNLQLYLRLLRREEHPPGKDIL